MAGILEGKVAIITGGSKGIGGATAELFVKEGASVVITARGKEALDKRVKELKVMGGKVLGIVADASSSADYKMVFARTLEEFGKIDILVNNAGIGNTLGIDKTTDEEWGPRHRHQSIQCVLWMP
jgi:NAD(P)-dependent dehydrogenase (short-subunit alcohol dehydrogenase family)